MVIYVDADACPVKPEIYKVAERHQLTVMIVAAAWMRIPADGRVSLEVVEQGFDAADDWIAERAGRGDIVITSDIPLAARCVDAGAYVLGANGRPFTAENVGDILATRNLLADMRSAGLNSAGPPPFGPKDRSRFLQELEKAIQALKTGLPERG